jgi:hypothetical protein
MFKIHEDATPLMIHVGSGSKQIGWRVVTANFTFDALTQNDKSINIYVNWNDDLGGDMFNCKTWESVKDMLDSFLKTSAI